SGWAEFADHIRAGKMRALAISAETAPPGVSVPTLRAQGLDVVFYGWRAIFAPPGIADADRTRLLGVVDRTVTSSAWKAELTKRAWLDLYLPGTASAESITAEDARIRGVLTQLKLA